MPAKRTNSFPTSARVSRARNQLADQSAAHRAEVAATDAPGTTGHVPGPPLDPLPAHGLAGADASEGSDSMVVNDTNDPGSPTDVDPASPINGASENTPDSSAGNNQTGVGAAPILKMGGNA